MLYGKYRYVYYITFLFYFSLVRRIILYQHRRVVRECRSVRYFRKKKKKHKQYECYKQQDRKATYWFIFLNIHVSEGVLFLVSFLVVSHCEITYTSLSGTTIHAG